jgi:hypothetical protein
VLWPRQFAAFTCFLDKKKNAKQVAARPTPNHRGITAPLFISLSLYYEENWYAPREKKTK